MLTHPTLDLLAELGLHGMAKGFRDLSAQPEARGLEHADWLTLLLDREVTLRRQRRFEARARTAHLRHEATVEDVDFRAARGLDRGLARGDGRYDKMLRALAKVDLLILDDWGPTVLDDDQRCDLLEIVEERYERRSNIVTSQVPIDRWYEIIGNPTIADAVLYRLVHNAHRIELTRDSLRRRRPAEPSIEVA